MKAVVNNCSKKQQLSKMKAVVSKKVKTTYKRDECQVFLDAKSVLKLTERNWNPLYLKHTHNSSQEI